ncbi:hypothetical protein B296_00025756, partial [Ensete ventricosum]
FVLVRHGPPSVHCTPLTGGGVLDVKQFMWPPKSQPSRRIKEPRELNPPLGAYKQLRVFIGVTQS